jgi:hypothetical protein
MLHVRQEIPFMLSHALVSPQDYRKMKQQRKPRAKRPFEAPKITESRSLDIGEVCSRCPG